VHTLAQFFSCRTAVGLPGYQESSRNRPTALVRGTVRGQGKNIEVVLELDYNNSAIVGTAIILAYTIKWRYPCVAWTDLIQVGLSSSVSLSSSASIKLAGGWQAVVPPPADHYDFFPSKGAGIGDWLWWWERSWRRTRNHGRPDSTEGPLLRRAEWWPGSPRLQRIARNLCLQPCLSGFEGITLVSQGVHRECVNEDSEKIVLLISRSSTTPDLSVSSSASLLPPSCPRRTRDLRGRQRS
jgi:hypothetical protein